MASNAHHRKVLVLSEEAAISNLFVLVKELGREHAVDSHGEAVLTYLTPRQIDSAIVDIRCSNRQSGTHGVREIWPSLLGRVLVINAEVYSPKTLQMIEYCLLHQTSHTGFLRGLANRLLAPLGFGPSAKPILAPNAQRK